MTVFIADIACGHNGFFHVQPKHDTKQIFGKVNSWHIFMQMCVCMFVFVQWYSLTAMCVWALERDICTCAVGNPNKTGMWNNARLNGTMMEICIYVYGTYLRNITYKVNIIYRTVQHTLLQFQLKSKWFEKHDS